MLHFVASQLVTYLDSPSRRRPQNPTEFHFCRIFPGDELHLSLTRHEHYLCSMLGIKSGITVLNIGSGVGDIAMELVRYADVNVVGVDASYKKVL